MIQNKYLHIVFFILLYSLYFNAVKAQAVVNYKNINEVKQTKFSEKVFRELERGISEKDITKISNLLSSQTYLNLLNGVSGYYSSNQAYYVLEDFFNIYRVLSFNYQNIESSENNPFATGIYRYEQKGKKGSAQFYIALKKVGKSWKITQITIN